MQLQNIQTKIYRVRGQRVMLDFDLAELYETETRSLKQAVKRNLDRFPGDFMFMLTKEEYDSLRSQIVTLENPGRGRYSKYLPFAFTEQGVSMLSSILKSKKAIQMNIAIIRTFVLLRKFALSHKELSLKLIELENRYNKKFKDVLEAINYLLRKDQDEIEYQKRKRVGFRLKGKED